MIRKLMTKILDSIAKKVDISEEKRQEIEDYDKKRERLIKIISKTPKLSKFKMFLINQFMTLFGCGKVKIAPGTIASFVTVEIWFAITLLFIANNSSPLVEATFWISVIIICSIYAVIFTPIYTKDLDRCDHPSIVIDEVVGQLTTLCIPYIIIRPYYHEESWLLPQIIILSHMFLSFLLFRTLDIAKPSVIGWIDKNIKNPFGVVLDDIVAGIIGGILILLLFAFYEYAVIRMHII